MVNQLTRTTERVRDGRAVALATTDSFALLAGLTVTTTARSTRLTHTLPVDLSVTGISAGRLPSAVYESTARGALQINAGPIR